jgi:hypothetical protein
MLTPMSLWPTPSLCVAGAPAKGGAERKQPTEAVHGDARHSLVAKSKREARGPTFVVTRT